jgi:putative membrane protein
MPVWPPPRGMRRFAREHTAGLAALLSVVALALVFGAALRVVPASALPRSPEWLLAAIPHVNAVISVGAIAAIVAGWHWVRRGRVTRHRAAMVTGFVLFVAFLALYLYKVALTGPTAFPGEGTVALAYFALLAVHILLAVVCVPLLFYVLLLAATRPVAEIRESLHPRVGRVAASLWLVSFALGVVVYLLLYVVY